MKRYIHTKQYVKSSEKFRRRPWRRATDETYILEMFEKNNIPMNMLDHVVEYNTYDGEYDRGFYLDTDIATAEKFNNRYTDGWKLVPSEWKLVPVRIDSPYYEDYHFTLYQIHPDKSVTEAAFMTVDEAEDYIQWYNAKAQKDAEFDDIY